MNTQGYYFALPRLVARLRGKESRRSEQNGLEANLVGGAMHLMVYLFAAHLLLPGLPLWLQLLLLGPLAFLVWFFWMIYFYIASLFIKLFQGMGMGRSLRADQAQGGLIVIMISVFAFHFVNTGSWLSWIGLGWLIAVGLNLIAGAFLALSQPPLEP